MVEHGWGTLFGYTVVRSIQWTGCVVLLLMVAWQREFAVRISITACWSAWVLLPAEASHFFPVEIRITPREARSAILSYGAGPAAAGRRSFSLLFDPEGTGVSSSLTGVGSFRGPLTATAPPNAWYRWPRPLVVHRLRDRHCPDTLDGFSQAPQGQNHAQHHSADSFNWPFCVSLNVGVRDSVASGISCTGIRNPQKALQLRLQCVRLVTALPEATRLPASSSCMMYLQGRRRPQTAPRATRRQWVARGVLGRGRLGKQRSRRTRAQSSAQSARLASAVGASASSPTVRKRARGKRQSASDQFCLSPSTRRNKQC